MNHQLLWLWLWFMVGMVAYMVKRAFYLITGPNPVANSAGQFIKVAGVPLAFRALIDSGIYWACFSPQVLQAGLQYLGWESASAILSVVTQFAVCALFFGLGIDTLVDWGIGTVISRIPIFKDFWPQMPPPLNPPPAPVANNQATGK